MIRLIIFLISGHLVSNMVFETVVEDVIIHWHIIKVQNGIATV